MTHLDDVLDGVHNPPNLRKVKACGYCHHYSKTSNHCRKFDAIIYSSCLCDDFSPVAAFIDPKKTGGLNNDMQQTNERY